MFYIFVSLYIYFFLLIIPIAQYDLITDDFSINKKYVVSWKDFYISYEHIDDKLLEAAFLKFISKKDLR